MQFKSQRFSFYFYSILFTVADGEKSDRSSVINVDISKFSSFRVVERHAAGIENFKVVAKM